MADRPIICSAPMVQALLAGRKTMTRRVLKPQPGFTGKMWHIAGRGGGCFVSEETEIADAALDHIPFAIGDRLWCREAHWFTDDGDSVPVAGNEQASEGEQLRSPIHMPRWASRLTLVVTDVRVQRVQDISEDDAIAEGIEATRVTEAEILAMPLALPGFRSLWNRIHGPDAWERNDWVAAVTFTTHQCNIDQMEKANV